MISSKFSLFALALLSVAFAFPQAAKNVEPSDTTGNTKSLIATPRNISLGESNMLTSWRVQAAEIVQESYELQSTDSGRLQMISELFSELHPYWYWNIALNSRYIEHIDGYYVEIFIDTDRLYMFSTL